MKIPDPVQLSSHSCVETIYSILVFKFKRDDKLGTCNVMGKTVERTTLIVKTYLSIPTPTTNPKQGKSRESKVNLEI